MEKFTIYRWDTGAEIASCEAESLKEALQQLVLCGTNLYHAQPRRCQPRRCRLVGARLVGASLDGASLVGARLVGASLVDASLDGARLVDASLDGASLVGASLVGARLDGASLVGARLDGASLVGASLDGARLVGARLDGARLVGASLVGASLDGARLDFIKHDLWGILLHVPNEVAGLARALQEGRVNGSVYEGDCACLVGTLANVRHCKYTELPGINPDSSRPAEIWFMGIAKGDTPETNQIVKITLGWIEEFQKLRA